MLTRFKPLHLRNRLVGHRQINNSGQVFSNVPIQTCAHCKSSVEKSIIGLRLGLFSVGVGVEIYTFNETRSIHNSTGLGWGILACICLT